MRNIRQKFIAGFTANAFGQLISIVIQIASLPLFLHWWTVEKYGSWIVLSAIPVYFSLSDIGFVTTAKNKMQILAAARKNTAAQVTFQSALLMSVMLSAALFTISTIAIYYADVSVLTNSKNKAALIFLIFGSLIALNSGLIEAVFRVNDKYAEVTSWLNAIRIIEWVFGMLALVWSGEFIVIALAMSFSRTIATAVLWMAARKRFKEYRWSFQLADKAEIRTLFSPSLAFMMFPIGNALSIQGLTLLSSIFVSPTTIALLTTYRTMSRLVVQVVGVISHTFWPEFSRLFGSKDKNALARLYSVCNKLTLTATAITVSLLILFAEKILLSWTHGAIPYERNIFLLFLMAAAAGSIWHAPRILLLASNSHTRIAYIFLTVSLVALAICYLIMRVSPMIAIPLSIIIMEMTMLFVSTKIAATLIKTR